MMNLKKSIGESFSVWNQLVWACDKTNGAKIYINIYTILLCRRKNIYLYSNPSKSGFL